MDRFLFVFLIGALFSVGVEGAPKTATTYDQKQTGEYNIQLHLKDFQIIAVVGDESFGGIGGDYDYNYDYADFTIKPITPPTTAAPSTNKTETATLSTTTTTTKQINLEIVNATIAPSDILNTTTAKPLNVTQPVEQLIPQLQNGQIPVFIQEFILSDQSHQALKDDKRKVESVAIVPSEDISGSAEQEQPTLGEIMHYRKCAQGYSRDKRGRCRKIRRPPQIPLDLTRFASNFASRFRQNDEHTFDESIKV